MLAFDDGGDMCDGEADGGVGSEESNLQRVDVDLVNLYTEAPSTPKDTSSYEMDAQIVMEKYQAQVKYNVSISKLQIIHKLKQM